MNTCIWSFYLTMQKDLNMMIKSFNYFYPDMNIKIFNGYDLADNNITEYVYPSVTTKLLSGYDFVTHIDADIYIVDKIDELFDTNYDALAGRNNSDNNKAGTNLAFTIKNLPSNKYVNAGIHSVSKKFAESWMHTCNNHTYGLSLGEQDELNGVFHFGGFNTKVLDPVDSNIYYGSSMHEGVHTHWDLWKNIIVSGDHLELNGKRIKLLHVAGGVYPKPDLSKLVSKDVYEFVMNILGE